MARYLVRVELHSANEEDYSKLHKAMKAVNFLRTIPSNEGIIYKLPTAEYFQETQSPIKDIFDSVSKAVASVGKKAGFIITEGQAFKWDGLETTKEAF